MFEIRRKLFFFNAALFLILIWINITLFIKEQTIFAGSGPPTYTKQEQLPPIIAAFNNTRIFFNKTLQGRGVLLSVTGGLGNQLFEFACAYALARDRKCPLYNFLKEPNILYESATESRKFLANQRNYVLDKLQIPLDNFFDKTTVIDKKSIGYVSDSEMLFRNYSDKPFLQLAKRSYCVSKAYFASYKNEILEMARLRPEVVEGFSPYVKTLEGKITGSNQSVAVHVRRGDYTKLAGFYIPISYHRMAIHHLIEILGGGQRPQFFVFSDDIKYARKNLSDLAATHEFTFVSGNMTSLEDFYLMTKCRHFIIATSTFAWWAAYSSTERQKLGKEPSKTPGRVVISSAFNPGYWRQWKDEKERNFYKMTHTQLYYPEDWIVLNPFDGDGGVK